MSALQAIAELLDWRTYAEGMNGGPPWRIHAETYGRNGPAACKHLGMVLAEDGAWVITESTYALAAQVVDRSRRAAA